MSRFRILRLTQAIKIREADITFCFTLTMYNTTVISVAHHDGFRITDGLARPTALLARPQDIALEMLAGYSSVTS